MKGRGLHSCSGNMWNYESIEISGPSHEAERQELEDVRLHGAAKCGRTI